MVGKQEAGSSSPPATDLLCDPATGVVTAPLQSSDSSSEKWESWESMGARAVCVPTSSGLGAARVKGLGCRDIVFPCWGRDASPGFGSLGLRDLVPCGAQHQSLQGHCCPS